MYNSKILFILFSFLTLLVARTPDWVEEHPEEPSSYIGIGVITKAEYSTREEYVNAARLQALNNISSAISVLIEGTSSDSYTTTETSSTSLYQADIDAYTRANLEGYELVDEFDGRREYWVFYRLDKAMWASIENRRLQAAQTSAISYLNNAHSQRSQGNVVSAVRSYIQAFEAIIPVLHLDPSISDNGTTVPLPAYIDSKVVSLLGEIEFNSSDPFYRGTIADFRNDPKLLVLKRNLTSVPAFPLLIAEENYFTSNDGELAIPELSLSSATSGSEYTVSVTTNLDAVLPDNENKEALRSWLSHMNWPSITARFIFEKPSIYIEALEVGYNDLPYDQLEIAIRERLDEVGYSIARFPEEAELRIMINSDTRPAGNMGSLYFSYLDLDWSVYNNHGDQLMQQSIDPVKGGALSYDDATVKAFMSGKDILADSVLTWVQENN